MTLQEMFDKLPPGFNLHKGVQGWSVVYSTFVARSYNPNLAKFKPPFYKKAFATAEEATEYCLNWYIDKSNQVSI